MISESTSSPWLEDPTLWDIQESLTESEERKIAPNARIVTRTRTEGRIAGEQ